MMNQRNWKTSVVSLGLAGAFMLSAGLANSVFAQDWRRDRNQRNDVNRRNGGYGQVDPTTGNIDNNRNGIDDRYETRDGRVDINQNGVADQDENYRRNDNRRSDNGRFGNDGYYRNNGYGNFGYNNAEFQRGYQDGLNRGRDDARTNRAMDPNNSSHYRSGNGVYRAGFEKGFYQSFRQYSNRRW
jgi:hypothetical protein